jgi:hypothetical protein
MNASFTDEKRVRDLIRLVELQFGSYIEIRREYARELGNLITDYLYYEGANTVLFKNRLKQTAAYAIAAAGDTAWKDGGGGEEMDPEVFAWLAARQQMELSHLESLADELKGLKSEKDIDAKSEGVARGEGYSKTLDYIYNQIKTMAAKNKMLTMRGWDGKVSCKTCQKLKGQRHKASWWINHQLVPGQGNTHYECGGFRCQHYLVDPDGMMWSV